MRHGPTPHNGTDPTKERIRGWASIGLSDEGRAIARASAAALKDHPPAVIFCSDLPRAHETAELVAKELGGRIPVVPMREMRTWHVGELSGKTVAEAKPALDRLQRIHSTHPAPGGESYADFYGRWGVLQQALRQLGQQHDVLAVVHGRHLWALRNLLKGAGPTSVATSGGPHPGDIVQVDEGKRSMAIVHHSNAEARVS